jgi:hypothetical protein
LRCRAAGHKYQRNQNQKLLHDDLHSQKTSFKKIRLTNQEGFPSIRARTLLCTSPIEPDNQAAFCQSIRWSNYVRPRPTSR